MADPKILLPPEVQRMLEQQQSMPMRTVMYPDAYLSFLVAKDLFVAGCIASDAESPESVLDEAISAWKKAKIFIVASMRKEVGEFDPMSVKRMTRTDNLQ